jgi:NADPH:quinone reductase-like Zn-dependent oxidoreductase
MARVVRFHEMGGPEVLRIEDVSAPEPGPGEVRIQVKAVGLNRADALFRSGNYIEAPASLPAGLGLEAAGFVEALGHGVSGLALGDSVSVVPPTSVARWPAHGELATFPDRLVVKHPASLSWQGAAAVWMQYLTAYGALIDIAGLGAGDDVVITAASSSVGLAAIQIANLVGARPIAVTRTHAKTPLLLQHGAAEVVASQEEDLQARLEAIAGRHGVRLVFDAVGGPAFEPLTAAMAKNGMLIEYGGLSSEPTPFPLLAVLSKRLSLRGYLVHEIVEDDARLEAAKAFVLGGLASGALRPIIDRAFAFEEIVAAHRFLESNQQFGKIVATL